MMLYWYVSIFLFSSKYKKIDHEHSIEIYFIQFLMSCFFVSQQFKNEIRHKSEPDAPVTTSFPDSLSY